MVILKNSWSEICYKNVRQANSLMMERVYNRYFWDVEMFWAATLCLTEQIFSKKVFLTKQYFWQFILLFYNTSIHDSFNKFNFLKSINDIVSMQKVAISKRLNGELGNGMRGIWGKWGLEWRQHAEWEWECGESGWEWGECGESRWKWK